MKSNYENLYRKSPKPPRFRTFSAPISKSVRIVGGKGGIRSRLRPAHSVRVGFANSGWHLTATGSHSLPTRSNPLDPHKKTKTVSRLGYRLCLAEREGFEPSVGY